MSEALDHMAARVADDPYFLAHPLAEYARAERLDDAALAERLGCRVEDLTMIRLCRAPRPGPADFRTDVATVVDRFGADRGKLMAAIRHGQGLAELRGGSPAAGQPGFLLAARDADPPTGPPS